MNARKAGVGQLAFEVTVNDQPVHGIITYEALLGLPSRDAEEEVDLAEVIAELEGNRDIAYAVGVRAADGRGTPDAPVSLSTVDYPAAGPTHKWLCRLLKASLRRLTRMQRNGTLGLEETLEVVGNGEAALIREDPLGTTVETALVVAYSDLATDPEATDLRRALAYQMATLFRRKV